MTAKRVALGVQAQAVQDFLHGRKTLDEIAKALGVTAKTVREWVRTWKRSVEMDRLGRGEGVPAGAPPSPPGPAPLGPKPGDAPAAAAPKKEDKPATKGDGKKKDFSLF